MTLSWARRQPGILPQHLARCSGKAADRGDDHGTRGAAPSRSGPLAELPRRLRISTGSFRLLPLGESARASMRPTPAVLEAQHLVALSTPSHRGQAGNHRQCSRLSTSSRCQRLAIRGRRAIVSEAGSNAARSEGWAGAPGGEARHESDSRIMAWTSGAAVGFTGYPAAPAARRTVPAARRTVGPARPPRSRRSPGGRPWRRALAAALP